MICIQLEYIVFTCGNRLDGIVVSLCRLIHSLLRKIITAIRSLVKTIVTRFNLWHETRSQLIRQRCQQRFIECFAVRVGGSLDIGQHSAAPPRQDRPVVTQKLRSVAVQRTKMFGKCATNLLQALQFRHFRRHRDGFNTTLTSFERLAVV